MGCCDPLGEPPKTTNELLRQLGYKSQSLYVTNKFNKQTSDVYTMVPANGFLDAVMSDEKPVRVDTAAFMLFVSGRMGACSIGGIKGHVMKKYGESLCDMPTFLSSSGLDSHLAKLLGGWLRMEITEEQAIEVVINGVDEVFGQENVQRAIDGSHDRDEIQRLWRKVVTEFISRVPSRGTLLANSVAVSDDGTSLTVRLPKDSTFAIRMLEKTDMKETVEYMASKVFGQRSISYIMYDEREQDDSCVAQTEKDCRHQQEVDDCASMEPGKFSVVLMSSKKTVCLDCCKQEDAQLCVNIASIIQLEFPSDDPVFAYSPQLEGTVHYSV